MKAELKYCSARDIREKYADIIAEVEDGEVAYIVTRYGQPVAFISGLPAMTAEYQLETT